MDKKSASSKSFRRIKAVAIIVLLTVITNFAVSYASGVSTTTDPPRPVSISVSQHSGVSTTTDPPRPVTQTATVHSGVSTYTIPPRP